MFPNKIVARQKGVALKGHCQSQHYGQLHRECAACTEILEELESLDSGFSLSDHGITVHSSAQVPQALPPITRSGKTTPPYLMKLRREIYRRKRILKHRAKLIA